MAASLFQMEKNILGKLVILLIFAIFTVLGNLHKLITQCIIC